MPMMDTGRLDKGSSFIQEFMENSYAYCRQHETEIREHIEKSENKVI